MDDERWRYLRAAHNVRQTQVGSRHGASVRSRLALAMIAGALPFAATASAEEAPKLDVWAVDPLTKVFRDAEPAAEQEAIAEVARGEHASLQFVVRCDAAIDGLHAETSLLTREGRSDVALKPRRPRFVGYVPVDRPMQTPSKDQLRKPPADYPDPLLEVESIHVPAGQAQPIWITVRVPPDVPPGLYEGQLRVTGRTRGKPLIAVAAMKVRVFDVTVGRSRLWVTNWFGMHATHMEIKAEPGSPAYWDLLRRYARNMADHRQSVAMISPLSLATFTAGTDGRLRIDFSTFDRWVAIFRDEGVIGRIEGGHLGGRAGGWESQFVIGIRRVENGKVVSASVDPAGPEADAFHAQFLPALVRHLREKGWLDIYMQHLGDEPIAGNAVSYRAMAALVRKYAPELRIVEACHTKDLVGAIDIWVPQLNYLHNDYDHYRARQREKEEVWFYTCVFPQGEYANRFIEQPLIKTRLLHWINYRYGITGYLHWGYNWWTQEDPFRKTTREHPGPPYLPAGDAWIVYPGKNGPLDSIRFEAMRDGIVDYELLCLLAERDKDAAMKLASKHVLAFDRYDTDVRTFRATRRELLERFGNPE